MIDAPLSGTDELAFGQHQMLDQALYVRFEMYPRKNEAKSLEAGHPVYDEHEYVYIQAPGDKETINHRPVRDLDRQRFARQYAAFKLGQKEAVSGLPLSEWPSMTRSRSKEYEFFGVRTVEQLANISDANCQGIQGSVMDRQRALDFLEQAKHNAPAEKMRAELADRDNKIAVLERQMAELMRAMEKATEPKPAAAPKK